MFFAALATGLILFLIGCLVYRAATRHRFVTREVVPRRYDYSGHDYYGSQHVNTRRRCDDEAPPIPPPLPPDPLGGEQSLIDTYRNESQWTGGGTGTSSSSGD